MSVFSASVIVPTYKRPDLLRRCLEALSAQRANESFEIIVVSDGPDSNVRDLVESWDADRPVTYLCNAFRSGPATARNFGARMALGEVLCFTDDDCVPDPDWVMEGLKAIRMSGAGAAWGSLNMPIPDPPSDFELNESQLEGAVFVTANCFVKNSVFERIGGFDTRFTTAWREDSDLYLRLLSAGEKIVHAPSAHILHPVRTARWGVSIRQQAKTKFDVLLEQKHGRLAYPYTRYGILPFFVLLNLCLALGILCVFAGSAPPGIFFVSLWAAGVLQFTLMRLRRTRRDLTHVLEMLVTSSIIPSLSLYWRLRGYLEFYFLNPPPRGSFALQTARTNT